MRWPRSKPLVRNEALSQVFRHLIITIYKIVLTFIFGFFQKKTQKKRKRNTL